MFKQTIAIDLPETRTAAEKRIADLTLCFVLPRTWPLWAQGINEKSILAATCDEELPWELDDL